MNAVFWLLPTTVMEWMVPLVVATGAVKQRDRCLQIWLCIVPPDRRGQRRKPVFVPSRVIWKRNGCVDRHGDVMKWKHFPIYWPFVTGIHEGWPVDYADRGAVKWNFDVFFYVFFDVNLNKPNKQYEFPVVWDGVTLMCIPLNLPWIFSGASHWGFRKYPG